MSGPDDRAALGHQFTDITDEDVEGILRHSGTRFGPRQRDIYAGLIDRAAEMVAEDWRQKEKKAKGAKSQKGVLG